MSNSTFAVAEDTFVKNTRPYKSYGGYSTLQADNYPSVKRILLRFRIENLPDGAVISSAILRMFVVDASTHAGMVNAVVGHWSEPAVTWSNAPAIGRNISRFSIPGTVGTWRQADVTAAVTGNGYVDFYVITPSDDGVDYVSKEGGGNAPTLTVRWSRPEVSPTPTGTSTSTPTSTPVPVGSATPAGTFQPEPPIQAAFSYPWFPNAWRQQGIYPYTNFSPALGYYSSTDNAIIDQQLRLAAQAHLEAFISSWWGPGHHTDTAFQHIIGRSERSDSPYRNLRWAIYHEAESLGDPSVAQIVSDLQYLAGRAFNHEGYLKLGGRPVVFVYASGSDGCGMADRWTQAKQQLGGNVYIVLKVFSGYRNCSAQPDSWHQYGPASPYDTQLPYAVAVSPGFWKVGETPRLARDPVRFESDVKRMVASGAAWQLVTTWNEWGEGTSVEPAAEFGTTYIDILCRNLPGPGSCGGGVTPTATPTPTPNPLPTPSPTARPTTAPTPTPYGDPVLVGAGDIASCGSSGDEATAALLDAIAGTVFVAGDLAYDDGTAAEFANCYGPTWGRHKARTRPAPGNHEYHTAGASGYFNYFGALAGDPGKGYYSYDVGAWHVVVLNSNCSEVGGCQADSAQERWLRADLAMRPAACTLAYWHHPLFTNGSHSPTTAVRPLYQALYDFGAELILNGHDHNYQRFAPQDANGALDWGRGVRQFVVGTGGKSLYSFTGNPVPNTEVRNNTAFGVLKLTLHPTSYDWQFVPVAGKTFTDSGSQACH